MVDTINELSDLSRKLNEKSDKTNTIITKINKKLDALNFGLEVWLQWDLEGDSYQKVYEGQQGLLPRQKSVTYLGYCNVETGWQLATKSGLLIEDWDKDSEEAFTELTDVSYQPLLKAARETRVGALPLVPRLLDELKVRAESTIKAIDEAEKAANTLTDGTMAACPKLTLRAVAYDSHIGPVGSAIIKFAVQGLPAGQQAFIANLGSNAKESWRILRVKNGVRGDWTGAYKKAADALAAIQQEFD